MMIILQFDTSTWIKMNKWVGVGIWGFSRSAVTHRPSSVLPYSLGWGSFEFRCLEGQVFCCSWVSGGLCRGSLVKRRDEQPLVPIVKYLNRRSVVDFLDFFYLFVEVEGGVQCYPLEGTGCGEYKSGAEMGFFWNLRLPVILALNVKDVWLIEFRITGLCIKSTLYCISLFLFRFGSNRTMRNTPKHFFTSVFLMNICCRVTANVSFQIFFRYQSRLWMITIVAESTSKT